MSRPPSLGCGSARNGPLEQTLIAFLTGYEPLVVNDFVTTTLGSLLVTYDDAFLQAIRDAPDDDTPRLIYADWLDEHGRSDRAEFIRIQIFLACLPEWHPQRAELIAKERELLGRYTDEWAAPLKGFAEDWEYRRGFIEVITITAESFFRQAEVIFQTAPVRGVRLQKAEHTTNRLAACPHLERINTLDLGGSLIGDDGLGELLSSSYLGRLRELGLSGTAIGWPGLDHLFVRSHLFTDLIKLELGGNDLGDEAVRMLVASPLASKLETLGLENSGLGNTGTETLASASNFRTLQTLLLSWNNISVQGVQSLVRSQFWANLVNLDLSFNPITDAGARELLLSPKPARLTSLNLVGIDIGERIQSALRERYGISVCRFG
jgi:uncharacterized protein (TIGR02996 family)